MNRRAPVLLTCLVALALVPSILTAQTRLFFGAGATSPAGDYGEYAKTGYLVNAGVGFALNPKLGVNFAGWYGGNSHDDIEGDKTTLYGLFGHLKYQLHAPEKTGLFVSGGLGFLTHKYSSNEFPEDEGSESNFEYSAAAGIDFPLKGKLGLYALAGYVGGEDTFLRFMAGITIPLGGSK